MDQLIYIALAILATYLLRRQIASAIRDEREPLIWYGILLVLTILAGTSGLVWQAIGIIGVGIYSYIKIARMVAGVQWNGIEHMVGEQLAFDRKVAQLPSKSVKLLR